MAFEKPIDSYSGKIREVEIGPSGKSLKAGGESTLPFYSFEGETPNPLLIAMEVYDRRPEDWAEAVVAPISDVIDDPVAWAKKCVETFNADMICVQLLSTDPNRENSSAEEAAELVKKVAGAINVPLIVYGSGNLEKDPEILRAVSEACSGMDLLIGPAQEDNYKQIVAPALAYKHKVIAQTPIDVNLAKQLNILIGNVGLSPESIVMDPSTGALGYGLEYTYSVIERDRLAALIQNDEKMQQPIVCNLGKEAWKVKEAKISAKDEPLFGDEEKRGILWEAVTAYSLVLAGANILIMRHPEAVTLVRRIVKMLSEG